MSLPVLLRAGEMRSRMTRNYLLGVYVPSGHEESLKAALFAAGAGKMGNYSHCCWSTTGKGQFLPLSGSRPAIGQPDTMQVLSETKIEMIVSESRYSAVKNALIKTHPYEEPAYHFIPINNDFDSAETEQ